MPTRNRHAPVSASALFSTAVRAFWEVEPRQPYPFFDYDPLTQLAVLPSGDPDEPYYRYAAQCFEAFLAAAPPSANPENGVEERLAIAHYFAAMAWFRIRQWDAALFHLNTLLERWPDYARPRLDGRAYLRRAVRADCLHLRFHCRLQLQPLSARLKSAAPLAVLQALVDETSPVLDVIEPRNAALEHDFGSQHWSLAARMEVMEPQPDQLRAAALPTVGQMVESAYQQLLPQALTQSGPQAVRAHLRALQLNSHFAALAQKLLTGIDAQILKSYFAQAQQQLNAHNFDGARAKYRQISAEYPDSDAAHRAEAALPQTVTTAVSYYKSEGDKSYQPDKPGQFLQPQTAAIARYAQMFQEIAQSDKNLGSGEAAQVARAAVQSQAEGALFQWAQALATDAKQLNQAKALLERHARDYPQSPFRPRVLLLLAMIEAGNGPSRQNAALQWLDELVTKYPAAPQAPEALWKTALLHAGNGRRAQAITAFQALAKDYPKSPRTQYVAGWITYLKTKSEP